MEPLHLSRKGIHYHGLAAALQPVISAAFLVCRVRRKAKL